MIKVKQLALAADGGPIDTLSPTWLAPVTTGGDDAPRIGAALLAAAAAGRDLQLLPGTYQIASTITLTSAYSNCRLLMGPGVVLNISLTYDEQFLLFNPTATAHTTITADAAIETSTVDVAATSGSGWEIVIGSYIFFATDRGRVSRKVTNVVGLTVTLDRPLWFALVNGDPVTVYTPLRNFHVVGNGARITGAFTGVNTDSRVIWLASTWECSVNGLRSSLTSDPTAVIGIDQGGRDNRMLDVIVYGNYTTDLCGLAIEGQENPVVRDCYTQDCYNGLWINLCYGGETDFKATRVKYGINMTPAGNPDLATSPGVRGMKIRAEITGVATTGSGMRLGTNCNNNQIDLVVDGVALATNVGIDMSVNASVTAGPSGNQIVINAKNVTTIVQAGNGGTKNQVLSCISDGCSGLAYVAGAGTEISVNRVRGSFATVAGGSWIGVPSTGKISVVDADVTIVQVTGFILASITGSGTVKFRDVVISKSGAGWAYGFLAGATAGTSPVIEVENSDLGSYGTAAFSVHQGATVQLRGRVKYTGTATAIRSNRRAVTLTEATAVPVAMPAAGLTANDVVRMVRATTGGTPGAVPTAVPTAAAATVTVPALSAWTPAGLSGFPGAIMVEDSATSAHEIASALSTGFVATKPTLLCIRALAAGRNFLKVGLGGTYSTFNVGTGAVGATTAAGWRTWVVATTGLPAGTYDLYCLVPTPANNVIELFMESADGTDSYAGNGASGITISSVTAAMVDYVLVTGVAGDTSVYNLEVA